LFSRYAFIQGTSWTFNLTLPFILVTRARFIEQTATAAAAVGMNKLKNVEDMKKQFIILKF